MPGRLFLLTGTSGAGKTTISQLLLKRNPQLRRVITYTTRSPRGKEKNGIDYHFVSEETFKRLIQENAFMEWAQVYDHLYGQQWQDVVNLQKEGFDVLLIVDPQGAKTLTQTGKVTLSFFLDGASDAILMEHLLVRATDEPAIQKKRLEKMAFDRGHAQFCDHYIINTEGNPEKTAQKIEEFMAGIS